MKKFIIAAAMTAGFCGAGAQDAQAGAEPFVGEIMAVGFSFCPRNWANADGQLLPIASNTALFSLLGTTYGGDGRTTFALPDLRGRVAVHTGTGPGLPPVREGQRGGRHAVNLTVAELPAHSHAASGTGTGKGTVSGAATPVNSPNPLNNTFGLGSGALYAPTGGTAVKMAPDGVDVSTTVAVTVNNTGGGQAVDVTNPYLVIRYCIALQGIFPSRP